MTSIKAITIIIVNWNSGLQLGALVASILAYHSGLVASVVIVDNASTDNSLGLVINQIDLPFQLHIVSNAENRGFAAACNQGFHFANSKYILFLNPDARLFENSLSIPYLYMSDFLNQDVGVAGVQLMDERNQVSRSCARFPSFKIFAMQSLGLNRFLKNDYFNLHMTDWAHDKTQQVDHVMGAFYLIRRSIFEALGGFDECYFVYLEDLDLSLRVAKKGYRSIFLANAQVFHAGGGTSKQVKAHRLFYFLRSRIKYSFKHFVFWKAWAMVFITLMIEPITRIFFALSKFDFNEIHDICFAYVMLCKDFGTILKSAKQ
jgi:GT2 family glycosyltransferase